jgi:ubiquinone/menaquinone biosynthesis C-methylase UbiE
VTVPKALYRFYFGLQRIIAPELRYCQEVYEDVLCEAVKPETRWLDLGCGHKVLPEWRSDQEKELTSRASQLVGVDYDMQSLRCHESITQLVRADISHLPFRDDSFELLASNMVFEHLREPDVQLQEIRRIMKPGGELIFLTPNTAGYTTILGRLLPEWLKSKVIRFTEGREEDDVFPTFYEINSPRKIERAIERSGMRRKEIRLIPSAAQLVKIPPLVFFELIWIRITMTEAFKALRTNLIVRCTKPE